MSLAHDPQDMELEYNYESQSLTVIITHNTPTPDSHFIESVEIYVNDTIYITMNYTSQPTTSKFSYFYDVTADDGNVIKVIATCSISGNVSRELTVQMPKSDPGNMHMELTNHINELEVKGSYQFNISITEGSGGFDPPITGATLIVEANTGTITGIKEAAGGQYVFIYTAPDITSENTETIKITALKDGYDNASFEFNFTIKKVDTDDDDKPTLDGKIGSKEYEFDAAFQGGLYKIYWTINNDTINLAMLAKTKGWVAIGIEPTFRMKDADMIFGWVTSDGLVRVLDAYSTGPTGPHPSDVSLGGTIDILEFGGSQENNWTIIEFTRKLDTGDSYDNVIPEEGIIDIIWAYGSNDDYTDQHSDRGAGTVNLTSGESEEIKTIEWTLHALLMTLGLLSLSLGVSLLISAKRRAPRIPAHKTMNTLGAVFAILGLIFGILMIQLSTGEHFKVPHAFLGLVTIIFILITLRFGFILAKHDPEVDYVRFRSNHKWLGRIALILLIINILLGLSIVGLI
jgi:hypothetical protein